MTQIVLTMAQALTVAGQKFREYEAHHRAASRETQGDPSLEKHRLEKAGRNARMAEMCEAAASTMPYQVRVGRWMLDCFTPEIAADKVERGDRLLEEVFELLQSVGYDFGRIPQLVEYVANRPAGEPGQELGGVSVCLFAAANAYGLDLGAEAERELARISEPETMLKIRAKQAAKPSMSPLPQ